MNGNISDEEEMQKRQHCWAGLAESPYREALQRVMLNGVASEDDDALARFACGMVLKEAELRARIQIEVGGVLR